MFSGSSSTVLVACDRCLSYSKDRYFLEINGLRLSYKVEFLITKNVTYKSAL
jgi:hypothetical protein